MPPRPFISYAREDADVAGKLYEDLRTLGAEPWLDKHDLLGGENWRHAIRRAMRECSHFVVLLSERSVNKRGFVQKEMREAVEILGEFPPDQIFMIPVRVDDVQPTHEALKELHWIDLFPSYDAGLRQLARSIGLDVPTNQGGGGPKRRLFWSAVIVGVLIAILAIANAFKPSPDTPAQTSSAVTATANTTQQPAELTTTNPLREFKWGDVGAATPAGGPNAPKVALLLSHYETPSGNRNVKYGTTEEQYLSQFAPQLARELVARGIPVSIRQQSSPVLAELQAAPAKFPVVIALHVNGANNNASGTETYVSATADQQTKTFAKRLHQSVVTVLDTRDRTLRVNESLVVTRRVPRAVLMELFFITNDSDYEVASARRDALAKKLAEEIAVTFGSPAA